MRRLLLFINIFFISCPLFAGTQAELIGVKIQSTAKAAHFVFILNKRATARVHYRQASQQLRVDFRNTKQLFNIDRMNLTNTNVSMLKTQIPGPNKLRFIFSIKGNINYKIYFLPSQKGHKERLQLDILSVAAKPNKLTPAILSTQLKKAFKQDVLTIYKTLHAETKQKLLAQNKPQGRTRFYTYRDSFNTPRLFNIVIDAGHGGKDSGARGSHGALEKNIVLAIARKLTIELNHNKNLHAVLTRSHDTFVPLRERLALARKSKADLFIAIHADAFFNKSATGASVYALSARGATTEAARWLAKQDNYSELGGVELDALQDRSPLLRSVLIDLAQTATIRDSLHLGNKVLDALDDMTTLHYKHVAQAPFVVLKSPDIPSILVETGFISNPWEERRLVNPLYQQQLARALSRGIILYVQNNASYEK